MSVAGDNYILGSQRNDFRRRSVAYHLESRVRQLLQYMGKNFAAEVKDRVHVGGVRKAANEQQIPPAVSRNHVGGQGVNVGNNRDVELRIFFEERPLAP